MQRPQIEKRSTKSLREPIQSESKRKKSFLDPRAENRCGTLRMTTDLEFRESNKIKRSSDEKELF